MGVPVITVRVFNALLRSIRNGLAWAADRCGIRRVASTAGVAPIGTDSAVSAVTAPAIGAPPESASRPQELGPRPTTAGNAQAIRDESWSVCYREGMYTFRMRLGYRPPSRGLLMLLTIASGLPE